MRGIRSIASASSPGGGASPRPSRAAGTGDRRPRCGALAHPAQPLGLGRLDRQDDPRPRQHLAAFGHGRARLFVDAIGDPAACPAPRSTASVAPSAVSLHRLRRGGDAALVPGRLPQHRDMHAHPSISQRTIATRMATPIDPHFSIPIIRS
jgi:hypothetical protein